MTIAEQLQQEQDKLDAKKEFYRLNKHTLDAIASDAKSLGGEVEIEQTWDNKPYVRMSVSGDKHKFAAAVRALRTKEFTTDYDPPKKGQSHYTAVYRRDDIEDVTLSFSSTSCRLVQVGTKTETKEVPVYETVCDELIVA